MDRDLRVRNCGARPAPLWPSPAAAPCRSRSAGPTRAATTRLAGGIVQQISGTLEGSIAFEGLLRGTGSVRVTGPLRLAGAVLFVDGDLTLEQGVSGVGAIIVTGSVTVRGLVDLVTDNVVALLAGGNLLLYGK